MLQVELVHVVSVKSGWVGGPTVTRMMQEGFPPTFFLNQVISSAFENQEENVLFHRQTTFSCGNIEFGLK